MNPQSINKGRQRVKSSVISGRSGSTQNLVDWQPSNRRLPMAHVVSGHRLGGLLALLAGVPWVYFSSRYLVDAIGHHGLAAAQSLLYLLVCGGLVLVVFGLSQLLYREEMWIDAGAVKGLRRGLSGRNHWQEPLANYLGVLQTHEFRRNEQYDRLHGNADYMVYKLSLHHHEVSKRVLLYESHNTLMEPPDEWLPLWKHYGVLFRLPLLDQAPGAETTCSPGDLDMPLSVLMEKGVIAVPAFDLTNPTLPADMTLHREADLWIVTLWPVRLQRNLIALFVMTAVVLLVGLASWHSGKFATVGLVAGCFAAVLLLTGIASKIALNRTRKYPDQVAIDARKLWYRRRDHRHGRWITCELPLSRLRRVVVDNRPTLQYRGEQVVITSVGDSIKLGRYLTGPGRRQLRDLLLHLIHQAG